MPPARSRGPQSRSRDDGLRPQLAADVRPRRAAVAERAAAAAAAEGATSLRRAVREEPVRERRDVPAERLRVRRRVPVRLRSRLHGQAVRGET